MEISLRHNIESAMKFMSDFEKKQIPFALKNTINDLLPKIKADEIKEMQTVFDRPTPMTLKGLYMKSATKTNLFGVVWLKDDFWTGLSRETYLYPQIMGGERPLKKSERWLRRARILRANEFLAPGPAAPLNQYGNLTGNFMVQVLSALGAAENTAGYMMNRTKRSKQLRKRRLKQFFAITNDNSHLRRGIWERTTTGPRLVLQFVSKPAYKQLFMFYDVAQRTVDREFSQTFGRRFNEAMRTAK